MKLFGIACGGMLLLLVSREVRSEETTNGAAQKAISAVRVELPFDARAGSMKAGKLCLPSGVLRVSDFVSSNRAFWSITEQAIQSNPNASNFLKQSNIELIPTSLDADSRGGFPKR